MEAQSDPMYDIVFNKHTKKTREIVDATRNELSASAPVYEQQASH